MRTLSGWLSALLVGAALGAVLLVDGGRPVVAEEPALDLVAREKAAPPEIQRQLRELRARIEKEKLPFTVGYTTAMDQPLGQLAGLRPPPDLPRQVEEVSRKAAAALQADAAAVKKYRDEHRGENPETLTTSASPTDPQFSWTTPNKVTDVRDQQTCGACWAFATAAVAEAGYAIVNGVTADLSEKHIMFCSGAASTPGQPCYGGWWAFQFLIPPGVGCAKEASFPYAPSNSGTCPTPPMPTRYAATAWGYAGGTVNPSVHQIKQALCTYGPVATAVNADAAFQAYTSGTFVGTATGVNHGVTIVGWDDTKNGGTGAWLIKNSWGKNWGANVNGTTTWPRGYMWIAYGANAIGYGTAWVKVRNEKVYPVLPVKGQSAD